MENQLALLACNGQAHPRAQLQWSRLIKFAPDQIQSEPISSLQPIFPTQYNQNLPLDLVDKKNTFTTAQVVGDFAQIGSLLLINNVQRNHSGIYVCQAINSAGEERLELELFVRGLYQ